MNYLLTLTLALAGCFGLQTLALHLVGGRTTKSESNYFSSIARIQNGICHPSTIALLGSSRTARMPDSRSLPSRFPHVANLGCDGASAAIILRAMDRGRIAPAPVVVIEGNTLVHDLEGRGHEVEGFLGAPWFEIGLRFRLLRADARPSAIVYSRLLKRKIGEFAESDGSTPLPTPARPVVAVTAPTIPRQIRGKVRDMADTICRLRTRGAIVCLVILPPPDDSESMNMAIPYALSYYTNTPLLDLSKDLPSGAVSYTDGIHMAPASAAAALRSILLALETE